MEERKLTGPVGDILIVSESGEPVASGKKLDDFDPVGSAQAVQSKLEGHAANQVIHVTPMEREGWNGKAARAVGCKAGNLATLDPQGNPKDSGLAAVNFDPAGSAQLVREDLTQRINNLEEIQEQPIKSFQLTIPGYRNRYDEPNLKCYGKLCILNLNIIKDSGTIPSPFVVDNILPEGARPWWYGSYTLATPISNNTIIAATNPCTFVVSRSGRMVFYSVPTNTNCLTVNITYLTE